MADHSAVTSLSVGDAVTVVQDVLKAGKNLRGLSGTVIETWEKCDVIQRVVVQKAELVKMKEEECERNLTMEALRRLRLWTILHGQVDKLKMGEQAKRIAKFEESRKP
ncbi:hypothetical protein QTG54_003615 [Skeletonema marinoi]|uniref:Uncharacterized protein n=1 Tax=Skeletonema marinoi TaxID=267567 RepID=A0AAD9DFE7_9STRA|nr:hypothetical protein QTG54_003615 [Skeletonema marinoi]